jgi:hypothetical protein
VARVHEQDATHDAEHQERIVSSQCPEQSLTVPAPDTGDKPWA